MPTHPSVPRGARRRPLTPTSLAAVLCALTLAACVGGDEAAPDETPAPAAMSGSGPSGLAALLADGHAIFGIFSGEHTREGGAAMAANQETDFVFYSLESGPFDIEALEAYMEGMAAAAGERGPHPVLLRVPPPHQAPATHAQVMEARAAGVDGIVYPHVQTAGHARVAAEALGDGVWPTDPDGHLLNVLIIEDREGIENARAILEAGGVSVAIPGPGDLRRAYEGDMVAVEEAIQHVLALCLEMDIPCGITAGVDDIATRLQQGFRVIIVTRPEALAVGKAAAGR